MYVTRAHVLRGILILATSIIGAGIFILGLQLPILFVLLALAVLWGRMPRVAGWSHGTARIVNYSELVRHEMLGDDGIILGTTAGLARPSFWEGLSALWSHAVPPGLACYLFLASMKGPRCVADRMIRTTKFTHLMTCALTGRGKGISVLIPNLLSYRHSCVVTDPKGELFEKSARHRREKFGHRIIRLDPDGLRGPNSDMFNPLDCIDDTADDFLDQCRDLADMLVRRSGTETEPFWNDAAQMVLTAFIAFVCACEGDPAKRTLDTVRDLLSSRNAYARALEIMQQVESHGGVIQRLGHSLTWLVDRELGGVLSNVHRQTEFLDSPAIMQNISAKSSFDPMWLRTGRVTIYLVLPHDKLETLAPLMRLWIGTILRRITRGTPSEQNPVLFFLDEAAHLGKIRVLEQAVTLMRGMGIRLWFIFQSAHQLNDCFGDKAKTILDNIDTQQHFAINSYEGAEEHSKRIGEITISVPSHGVNSGWTRNTGGQGPPSGSESGGWSVTLSAIGRRLFRAEELIVRPEDEALIFHRNLSVIPGRLLTYFGHPAFKNGGTGDQPGLGWAAVLNSVCLLVVCILWTAGAAWLWQYDSWLPHARPRHQQQRSYRRDLPGREFSEWPVSEWPFPEE